MTSLSVSEQRQQLRHHLEACRASTLQLTASLTPAEYDQQAHPDFSPVGWHLGHIALTESRWILQHLAGADCPLAAYHQLFAADGLPKAARQHLPDLPQVLELLQAVRQRVWGYLGIAPLDQQLRLWLWLLQHECQHAETISLVLALHRHPVGNGEFKIQNSEFKVSTPLPVSCPAAPAAPVYLPPTTVTLGYDGVEGLDNERPVHRVKVKGFWLDPYPVTQGEFRGFMAAGGYAHSDYWSPQGWAWQQRAQVSRPRYWCDQPAREDHPVCGVSYYEAEAYATFVGKRLPTEVEWERAAGWSAVGDQLGPYPWGQALPQIHQANLGGQVGQTTPVHHYPAGQTDLGIRDLIGNVWEWTASWFEPYPGFQSFPYGGYSAAYFDRQHRVLRGGSWATRPWALRSTLRNWYHPYVREIFAGFRCAQDADGSLPTLRERR
ncbi:MAG TPA: ergothioneine biosynthesis protein EgtB [Leptolyngbyaceae cyanobacterium M65_K2018_010]|nr:ergothioneine biosynthesis protein EgtB [Leptolyngbyaceae cyanobacterium M65_K2018_010]